MWPKISKDVTFWVFTVWIWSGSTNFLIHDYVREQSLSIMRTNIEKVPWDEMKVDYYSVQKHKPVLVEKLLKGPFLLHHSYQQYCNLQRHKKQYGTEQN